MKTHARIEGGNVAEIVTPAMDSEGAEIQIDARFHSDIVAALVDVTTVNPAPQVGWSATQIAGVWTFAAPAGPTLADLKTAKNTEINQARATANQTTFSHLGFVIACDALSRSDIDAVAIKVARSGAYTEGFPMGWKAVDNRILPLPTVADFDAFYNSMVAQGTANFNHSQQLKATLEAATTKEQIDAIVW